MGWKRIAAAIVVAAAVTAAPAEGKTATKLTIDSAFYASGQTHWAGDIFSAKKACKDDRKISVFRVRSGDDQKVGTTRSFKGEVDNNYYWTHYVDGAAPRGKYYAKAPATKSCEGAKSGKIEL